MKRSDSILARIIDRVGPVKFELDDNHYEAVVGSIIFQQLAGSAARAILNRFKQLYGGRVPTPREYLSTDVEKLRGSGLSPQKISYITGKWQIMRLLGRYRDQQGDKFRLGAFHDQLLSYGTLPVSVVEWLMFDDDASLQKALR